MIAITQPPFACGQLIVEQDTISMVTDRGQFALIGYRDAAVASTRGFPTPGTLWGSTNYEVRGELMELEHVDLTDFSVATSEPLVTTCGDIMVWRRGLVMALDVNRLLVLQPGTSYSPTQQAGTTMGMAGSRRVFAHRVDYDLGV